MSFDLFGIVRPVSSMAEDQWITGLQSKTTCQPGRSPLSAIRLHGAHRRPLGWKGLNISELRPIISRIETGLVAVNPPYSHSIVPGGFEVMS